MAPSVTASATRHFPELRADQPYHQPGDDSRPWPKAVLRRPRSEWLRRVVSRRSRFARPTIPIPQKQLFPAGPNRQWVYFRGTAGRPAGRGLSSSISRCRASSATSVEGTTMSDQFEGGCLCGAVRFVMTGQSESVAWCHCRSCRRHSGAPVSVFAAFKRTAYVVTKGEITRFNSSPGRWRGFCARCGSTLTCEGEPSPETHFDVGAFDQAARLRPTRHIFVEEHLPWLHLAHV